uniref:hypothetical protein n=1 Tax=Desulfoluna sp. TaxID=2045199 RepID=UPI002631C22A
RLGMPPEGSASKLAPPATCDVHPCTPVFYTGKAPHHALVAHSQPRFQGVFRYSGFATLAAGGKGLV